MQSIRRITAITPPPQLQGGMLEGVKSFRGWTPRPLWEGYSYLLPVCGGSYVRGNCTIALRLTRGHRKSATIEILTPRTVIM